MSDPRNPFEARQRVLEPLLVASKLLSVLEGAEERGVVALLVERPASVAEVATTAGIDPAAAAAVVDVLLAGGVVTMQADTVALTDDWHAMCRPGGFTPFATLTRGERVAADRLRRLGGADDYWSMPSEDRIAMAAAISPDPIEGGFVEILKQNLKDGHPFAVATSQAKRTLELGCGLAGSALSELRAFPGIELTVAVELSDDLATEAERRAEHLGLADRFKVVRCDAAEFSDPEPFDVGFWSQFFFAEETRQGAVRTLFQHIRPGGAVAAPVRWYDASKGEPTSQAAQQYAQFRLAAQASGVPERSPDQVQDELRAAGFVDAQTLTRGPTNMLVLATRP